jgi:predicted dehydrogenase
MNEKDLPGFNRRDFLRSGSFATVMTMLGGVPLVAEAADAPAPSATDIPMKVGVIGLGARGREIVNTLARINAAACTNEGRLKFPKVEIAAMCDTYHAAFRRAAKDAPTAKQVEDYHALLDDKEIQAVIIATPTHLHKEPVLAALQAGKHVYCEAPLAQTIEDARTIALAAKAAGRKVFQCGLQMRSDPQRRFLWPFIRSGALGQVVEARAQWHKKTQWRTAAPTPEREQELNWRLRKATSLGLIGELGVHPLDQISWFLDAKPVAVTGYGGILCWKDDRDVPDTVQAVFEYPGGVKSVYDATLANSFDADYEMLYGSDAAVMMRVTPDGSKAWMFKEVDSPNLGWEVYARKDAFFADVGIALVADASKSVSSADKAKEDPLTNTPLWSALVNFVANGSDVDAAVADFLTNYGADDPAGLQDSLSKKKLRASAGYLEGYQATVMAIKANEAINTGQRIEFKPEWYELG